MLEAWQALLAALIAGAIATVLLRALAIRFGIFDQPNPIVPQHQRPVAYLGGVAVGVGVAAGLAVGGHSPPIWILGPAVGFLFLGLFDDMRPLEPALKLTLQAAVASAVPLTGGGLSMSGSPILDGALTIAWIILVVNAFNVTDVSDGLVSSIAAAALLAWALFAPPDQGLFAGLAAAAVLGFLPFNWPQASIYLGDAGSHLIGYLVAALVLVPQGSDPLLHFLLPLVAAIPLFEVALLIVLRRRQGLPVWRGSPHHFALLLQQRQWKRSTINMLAASASFALAGAAAAAVAWQS